MENNNNSIYLAMEAGVTEKGEAYGSYIEAFVNSSTFVEADEANKKPAVLRLSCSVGRNPWLLLGEKAVEEEKENEQINENRPFLNVTVFGKMAEDNKDIEKKQKILVSGKASKNTYKDKEGVERHTVQMVADNLLLLPTKRFPGSKPTSYIRPVTTKYVKKDGTEGINKTAIVTGKVTNVQDPRKTSTGRDVLNFDLEIQIPVEKVDALINGTYDKNKDYGNNMTIRCAVWGSRASKLGKVVAVGNTLAVNITTYVNEYNGKFYVNGTVRNLSVLEWAATENETPKDSDETSVSENSEYIEWDDEEYGELPF